jgi:hypothetical protein
VSACRALCDERRCPASCDLPSGHEGEHACVPPGAASLDDQAWFWTPEWQAKEREADEDIAAGRFERFYSDEEFLAAMQPAAQAAPGQAQAPSPVSADVAAPERRSEGRRPVNDADHMTPTIDGGSDA